MKVLFQIRPGYRDGPSGDSIQMFMTKIYLEKLGINVSISSRPEINLGEFDLIHIFNCARIPEAFGFYKNAVNQRKKIVLSPIFIDMHEYYRNRPARLAAWRAENLLRREMFQGSHMLLPNSNKELEWIQEILMVNTKAKVIYLGVDPVFFGADRNWFIDKYGLQDFILCVGRLSPIKNQLSLIRAMKDLDIPIVLIGPVNNKEYAIKCTEQAEGQVKYIPPLNQKELASAYCAARVHVQPSWFETVGLTSLEAAASSTPVVITDRGAAREYFGDLAEYVKPDNLESIRKGIMAAMKQKPVSIVQNRKGQDEQVADAREDQDKQVTTAREDQDSTKWKANSSRSNLKSYIRERFTWRKAAQDTLEAYEQVLTDNCQSERESLLYYSQSYPLPELDSKSNG